MNYYPFHLGDYIRATAHLSPIEDIVYRRLIDLYYDSEKRLLIDCLALARRIRMPEHEKTVEAILGEFFEASDQGWKHEKCDKVIADYHAKSEQRRAAGRRGGRAKAAAKQTPSKRLANQEPRTKNQTKDRPKKYSDLDMATAIFMWGGIKALDIGDKEPNLEKWADVVRLMRERDDRSHGDINELFKWANNDPFWSSNIRSPAKLREKWPTLLGQMKRGGSSGSNGQSGGSRTQRVGETINKLAGEAAAADQVGVGDISKV